MHLHTRNVNTCFRELVTLFHRNGTCTRVVPSTGAESPEVVPIVKRPSRNGTVLMIDEPVCLTYSHPTERVLFNAARDANPFFHLYEALWMLAGRNDVAPLAYYAKQMEQYSDDGKTLNGAYGYRWRHAKTRNPRYGTVTRTYEGPLGTHNDHDDRVSLETDQLDVLVTHLKADPNSRRAVLQMWNVEDDLMKIGCKCGCGGYLHDCPTCGGVKGGSYGASKDVCCNLSVMFSVRFDHDNGPKCTCGADRTGPSAEGHLVGCPANVSREQRPRNVLDMTVTNRSNDMVWGMLGANYVHFTFLQEYVAARLGVEVGRYHHFTNNLHVYDEPDNPKLPKWKPEEWLADKLVEGKNFYRCLVSGITPFPLVKDPAAFERELPLFVSQYDGANVPTYNAGDWDEHFFRDVAAPALRAFRKYKEKCPESATGYASQIKADDWRIACTNWLQRRIK